MSLVVLVHPRAVKRVYQESLGPRLLALHAVRFGSRRGEIRPYALLACHKPAVTKFACHGITGTFVHVFTTYGALDHLGCTAIFQCKPLQLLTKSDSQRPVWVTLRANSDPRSLAIVSNNVFAASLVSSAWYAVLESEARPPTNPSIISFIRLT